MEKAKQIVITFPSSLGSISPIRKFIYDLLIVHQFSERFAYRTEVIVDELCNNAIHYGSQTSNDSITLKCVLDSEKVEISIEDYGGSVENIERLKKMVSLDSDPTLDFLGKNKETMGLDIVKMLSESVNISVNEHNIATLSAVKRKESKGEL